MFASARTASTKFKAWRSPKDPNFNSKSGMRNGLLCLSLFFPLYRVFPLSQNVLWNDSCVFDLWWQWRKQPFLLDFVLVCSQISRILEFCTVLKFSSKNALLLLPLASYVPTLEWEWIGMVPKGNFMLISEALYIFLKRIKWKKNKAGRFSQARAQTHGSCKGSIPWIYYKKYLSL